MNVRRRTRIAALTCLLFPAGLAYSHDIWLLPDRFVLGERDTLVVRQFVGTELDSGEELPLLRRMTRRFELVTADARIDLLAALPPERELLFIKPILSRTADRRGPVLVAMEHDFIHTEFPRSQFLEYIQHEGLDVRPPQRAGRARDVERERYARALKSLVQVGRPAGGDLYRRVLGQTLEIVLLQNPYTLNPGDTLDVQVLFEGRPLAGRQVTALNRQGQGPVSAMRARTNAQGVARFTLDRAGTWLVRLVHMLPCTGRPDADCELVDWESHWASFSFELD
jgi:uncharacterized GH25 family protein